jgi:predicted metallo-beta-lactamase superfamily hydrolase
MLGFRYSKRNLEKSVRNLGKIVRETKVKKLVLEHHLLRDLQWKKRIKNVYMVAKKEKVQVMTFAEFLGRENEILEARRKELYKEMDED